MVVTSVTCLEGMGGGMLWRARGNPEVQSRRLRLGTLVPNQGERDWYRGSSQEGGRRRHFNVHERSADTEPKEETHSIRERGRMSSLDKVITSTRPAIAKRRLGSAIGVPEDSRPAPLLRRREERNARVTAQGGKPKSRSRRNEGRANPGAEKRNALRSEPGQGSKCSPRI